MMLIGENEVNGEESILVSLSATNLMWTYLRSNLSLWGGMHMPDCLNKGMPIGSLYELCFSWFSDK
jgi:hypothetical protein